MRRLRSNPLPPFHEEDREPIRDLIARVCGCSDRTLNQILEAYQDGDGLASATRAEIRSLGATPKQASRLEGAFELGRRIQERALRSKKPLRTPGDVTSFVRAYLQAHLQHLEQESFLVLLLNARQGVIGTRQVHIGSMAHVDVHPREVFRNAVRMGAHSIIVVHNHPSGDADPSPADIELTKRLVEVGRNVGVPMLDHLIIGGSDSVSLLSLGLIPNA